MFCLIVLAPNLNSRGYKLTSVCLSVRLYIKSVQTPMATCISVFLRHVMVYAWTKNHETLISQDHIEICGKGLQPFIGRSSSQYWF